jgi:predicted RND superfamily exporter protein
MITRLTDLQSVGVFVLTISVILLIPTVITFIYRIKNKLLQSKIEEQEEDLYY